MKKTLITLAALAMGAVAQAEDVSDATWAALQYNSAYPTSKVESSGQNYDFSTKSGEYTMIFVLNRDEAKDAGLTYSNPLKIEVGAAGSGMYWKHSINLHVNEYNNFFATLWVDGQQKYPIDGASSGSPYVSDTDKNGVFANETNLVEDKIVYTLKVSNSTWMENVTTTNDNGEEVTSQVQKSGLTFTIGTIEGDETLSWASWTREGWAPDQAFDSFSISNGGDVLEQMLVFEGALSDEQIIAVSLLVVPEPTTATLSLLALAGLAARRRRK